MHLRALAFASLLSGLAAFPARADAPVAPLLSMQAAHKLATDALASVLQKLPAADRQKIVGAYVAFHADPRDPNVFAGCDDDGDYVIVMSDAMLVLADAFARAKATDEAHGTEKVAQYAAFLANGQRPGERLLAPPPGFFERSQATPELSELQSKHFRALVTHLLAAEAAHMLAGDLVCTAPTATHERGDDVWTGQEHATAFAAAAKVHDTRHVVVADARGTGIALAAGESESAMVSFLMPLMAAIELSTNARASFGYARLHPGALVRTEIVRTAALRQKGDKKP